MPYGLPLHVFIDDVVYVRATVILFASVSNAGILVAAVVVLRYKLLSPRRLVNSGDGVKNTVLISSIIFVYFFSFLLCRGGK